MLKKLLLLIFILITLGCKTKIMEENDYIEISDKYINQNMKNVNPNKYSKQVINNMNDINVVYIDKSINYAATFGGGFTVKINKISNEIVDVLWGQ